MQAIPHAFLDDGSINPEVSWLSEGKGYATIMHDGIPVLIRNHKLYRCVMLKPGKTAPEVFEETRRYPDGSRRGWTPVGAEPESEPIREAWSLADRDHVMDGTYELIGPAVGKNSHGVRSHKLIRHGTRRLPTAPRTIEAVRSFLALTDAFGLVWHYPQPDGTVLMAKVLRSRVA